MKKTIILLCLLLLAFTGCNNGESSQDSNKNLPKDAVCIELSDNQIKVDGDKVSFDPSDSVYVGNDIVYYEEGKDFTYGEGTSEESHSIEEAKAHTVVHITNPGTYGISGNLSKGQIAVDLGEEAKEDPNAVVTLIMNDCDVTCEVAPAVIFYNVYECGDTDLENASKDVDTSKAGANVVIADGTTNNINGSYVAKIYKPGTVVLNDDKTEVEDAKKLHKYDGAFYSKMSMNIDGDKEGTGVLNIKANNEGLGTELHLTINGGDINIESGNDGINTNEDSVSVTTINGGNLNIKVTGETGEGDGIDSNGWLVINGGKVVATACSDSQDAGIDSDMGIYLNGGTVVASGHMLDRIEDGGQNYVVFNTREKQIGSEKVYIKDQDGNIISDLIILNDYSVLLYSSSDIGEEGYTLWDEETQIGESGQSMMVGPGMNGMRPGEMEPPNGMAPPDGFRPR